MPMSTRLILICRLPAAALAPVLAYELEHGRPQLLIVLGRRRRRSTSHTLTRLSCCPPCRGRDRGPLLIRDDARRPETRSRAARPGPPSRMEAPNYGTRRHRWGGP